MKKISLIIISIFIVQSSFAQWSAMGTLSGTVRTLCVHNGELYAGGDFSGLVKKWNGTNAWVSVGSLTGTRVNTLYDFNGTLYAGGLFPIAGSTKGNIAKLSGSNWVASESGGLGGSASTEVKCLYKFNNVLYAGGTFDFSGTTAVSKIAKLNSAGTVWSQAGGGAPSKCGEGVFVMISYYNELYVGGQGTAPWMNKLNTAGTTWVDLSTTGAPTTGTGVYAFGILMHYPSANAQKLFFGGKFSGGFYQTVGEFYNNSWATASTFSAGTSDQVNCFASGTTSTTGTIFAGGVFTTSTHNSVNIAKRTSASVSAWDSVGSNAINGGIRALCFFGGYLVAGGDFTSPGSHVARLSSTVDVEEISDNIIVNTFYPNPIIKEALLKVQTKNELQQPELKMLDVNGNEMLAHTSLTGFNHSQNEVEFKIDREGLAAGIYYYMVLDAERIVATGKVIVE